MRGGDVRTEALFSCLSCEARVPRDHPLRPIRTSVDQALTGLSAAFNELYSDLGRPSVPPEKLLRALLLQALYSVRSERQPMEQLDSNLLFRGFVGLAMDAPIWDPTVFTKTRDRFLERATLGADKAYAVANFVADLRALNVTPQVAQNTPGRVRRSTVGPRASPATRPVSARASGSRKRSAGSRRWAACARPASAASNGSAGCSR